MTEQRYKYVNVDIDTYEKLVRQAEQGYRSVPGQIRFLVDLAERERAPELDERLEALAK